MFRVRLASGEEAVFRSVEELALGIQSGVVSASALVFHSKTDQWLPITVHPEYAAAQERAGSMVATEEPRDLEPLATVGELLQGGQVPVYQMFSRSAKELAARKKPRWILPAASAFVGVVFLVGVGATLLSTSTGPDEVIRTRELPRATTANPSSIPSAADEFRNIRMAPYNLANRMAQAGAELSASFTDSVKALALGDLLDPARLSSTDSIAAIQAGLARFRALRNDYRIRANTISTAYDDSASAQLTSGAWGRVDMAEWRARLVHFETTGGAARTELLLQALDELYALLTAERATIQIDPDRVRFLGPKPGADYDRLRSALNGYASLEPAPGERFPVPLLLLIQSLKRSSLPPRAR